LYEGNPQGMHADEIAAKNNMDPRKLARLLRMLTIYHFFQEVSPNVFKHNRLSSLFHSGKTVEEIHKQPTEKYSNCSGMAPLLGHATDECFKGGAYLADNLTDPATASSNEPDQAPHQRAFRTDMFLFPWLELPENEKRLKRFNRSMHGASLMAGDVSAGFDWTVLPKNSLVVDVGGGVGSTTLNLLNAHKHLRYIVQDRAPAIKDAQKFWEAQQPEALSSGQVDLQVHDFFEENPVRGAAVFILRMILHDWPDHYATRILRALRAAATSTTQLLILDPIVRYACPASLQTSDIAGVAFDDAPSPLLPNLGIAGNVIPYHADLQMMIVLNSQERTVADFVQLFASGGWKLRRVYMPPAPEFPKLVAVPI